MAAAAAPSFHSTRETTNYARLCRLLVDVGSDVLRKTFEKKRPTGNLDTVLSSPSVHKVLLSLKKKVLNPQQWGKLYPPIKSSVIKEFRYHSTDGFAEEYMRSCSSSYRLGYTSSCNRHNPWGRYRSHQVLQKHSLWSCQPGLSWWPNIQSILAVHPRCTGETGGSWLPKCYLWSEKGMHGPWFRRTL